jgi:hypothetical protein
MTCQAVNRRVSAYLDGFLSKEETILIEAHVESCPACTLRVQQLAKLRTRLRELPRRAAPPQLSTQLRVMASRERARNAARASLGTMVERWVESLTLTVNNLMRPLALPLAGGLASAMMLFGVLVPQVWHRTAISDDVPTMLATEASLKSTLSFGLADNDIVVDVLVDGSGRMMDYWVVEGQPWAASPNLRLSIEKTLLCTQFTPATMFGRPASGKLRITLRRSHVEVKG